MAFILLYLSLDKDLALYFQGFMMTLTDKLFTLIKIMAFSSFCFAVAYDASAFEQYAQYEKAKTMSKIRTDLWFDGVIKEQSSERKSKKRVIELTEIKVAVERITGPNRI